MTAAAPDHDSTTRNPRVVFVMLGAAMVLGAASQALFGLSIARWFAPTEAGAYFIGLSITTLVGYLGRIGSEQLALRDASPAWSNGDRDSYGAIAELLRSVLLRGTIVTAIATAAVLLVVWLLARPDVLTTSPEIWLAVVLLLPMNLLATGCALLRAADEMVASVAMRYLAVFLPALGLLSLGQLVGRWPNSPTLATLITASVAAGMVWRRITRLSGTKRSDDQPTFESIRPAAIKLTTSTALNAALTWSDRIILGTVVGAAAVGIYGAAWQLILPFNLIFLLGGTISSPTFSRLHADNDIAQLEATTRSLSLVMLLAASVAGAVLFIATPPVLAMLGAEYADARSIVAILIVGQIVNLGSGPIGNLFAMAKEEEALLQVTMASALLSVSTTIALTAVMGATGTALGVTVGLTAKNIGLVLLARQRLDISPVVFLPRQHSDPTSRPLARLLS